MSRAPRLALALLIVVLGLGLALHMSLSRAGSTADLATARAVAGVSMTVANMDRSIDFYSTVLFFEKVSDVEVAGDAFERLQGIFGARARIVTLRLGDERLELTEYLASRGRPALADARSNDRWFQHVAIVVNDIDQAYLAPTPPRHSALAGAAAAAGWKSERRGHPRVRLRGSGRPCARDPPVSARPG